MVAEVERDSRERERLRGFETEARRELGMVGEPEEVAERVDQLRRAWMRERLVEWGTERARALGWHDVYTFTKSLTERLMLRERGDLPLIILRPAIIESSHSEPRPGWIQGSRMADPIIMAYAKGVLHEFPGDPESLIDIVPVDHVVNAILAAGARRPEEPEVFQVASGERNPLRYRELYDHVREYFVENPLRDSGGRPIPVAEWSFPGRRSVERRLKSALVGLRVASEVVSRLPEGHVATDLRGRVARAEKRARMSLYYSRIYGPYSTIASIFSTRRTKALYEALPREDQEQFPFDIADVDWRRWLQGTHLPALTTRPGRKRRRKAVAEKPGDVAAIFDVDGTLVGSNVVSYYAWLKMRELPAAARPAWLATFLTKIPYYWGLDKVSRAHFNRAFYKNYAGWKPARARHLGQESFAGFTLSRIYPEALACLRDHKAKGHRVVLLSGALDFLLEPMKDLADDVLCSSLAVEDGEFTGELSGAPVAGEARARMLASYARKRNVDLSRSFAYADAISDLPMLEAVGNPVAVNPDRRLASQAEERGMAGPALGQERRRPQEGLTGLRALVYRKSVPRYLLMRAAAGRVGGLETGRFSPLQLEDVSEPDLPTPEWVRIRPLLSGICGSDLGTLSSENSPYFSPITSPPFVLGHEVFGVVAQANSGFAAGERVVFEPALGCEVRGIEPPCPYCASGRYALCVNVARGDVSPGIQTGFCHDTGGGWSDGTLVAHPSQLHRVPDEVPDEAAVAVEPLACAVHAAITGEPGRGRDGARDRGRQRRSVRRRGAEEVDPRRKDNLRRQARPPAKGGAPPRCGRRGAPRGDVHDASRHARHGGPQAGDRQACSYGRGREGLRVRGFVRDHRGRTAPVRPRRPCLPRRHARRHEPPGSHRPLAQGGEPLRILRLRGGKVPGREGQELRTRAAVGAGDQARNHGRTALPAGTVSGGHRRRARVRPQRARQGGVR